MTGHLSGHSLSCTEIPTNQLSLSTQLQSTTRLHNADMASSECTPRMMCAHEIAAFSDIELDQYLDEHRLGSGGVDIDVEDPENLPESFIQRLR